MSSFASSGIDQALALLSDGLVIGLGSGRASTKFIHALGVRVHGGLKIRGVPTSLRSEKLALELGIPLVTFDEIDAIDIAVDGADEVDPNGNLIKGYGGALVREKVVAEAAKKFIVLVGPEKSVGVLGQRGKLPVEVIPFASGTVAKRLLALNCKPVIRLLDGKPFITDNGNLIFDCQIDPIVQPVQLEAALVTIPGVLGTGLFLGMEPTVFIEAQP